MRQTDKVVELKPPWEQESRTVIHQCQMPTSPARLAVELARQLAFATAVSDGEDSAGRQRLRLLDPGEVAMRACDVAEKMWEQFEARGWLLETPGPTQQGPQE